MNHSLKTGLCFGLTSGIITTLGLLVGLHSGTRSTAVVIGGILTIAIADAFSDALGIHVSEESENVHSQREIWESTLATFFSKFLFSLTFLVPVFIFELDTAVFISIVWGLGVLTLLSYRLARSQNARVVDVVGEHLVIALVVIGATHLVGSWIYATFGV